MCSWHVYACMKKPCLPRSSRSEALLFRMKLNFTTVESNLFNSGQWRPVSCGQFERPFSCRVMTIGYSIHVFLEKGFLSDDNENYIILYSSFVNL